MLGSNSSECASASPEDVDREADVPLGVADRCRPNLGPALLLAAADAVAEDRHRRRLACEDATRRQCLDGKRVAASVEQLEALHQGRDRRPDELLGGLEAEHASRFVVGEQELAVLALDGDRVADGAQDRAELIAGLAQLLLDRAPVDRDRDVIGDGARDLELLGAQLPRLVEVEHVLPEQPLAVADRDERDGADALDSQHIEKRLERRVGLDVGNDDRRGVARSGRPGRVPLDGRPVGIREAVPGAESHHAGVVEQQHRGTIGAQRLPDALQRPLAHLIGVLGPCQRSRQLVQRPDVLVPALLWRIECRHKKPDVA